MQTPLNCQIRLQIKRTGPRHLTKLNFSDRNVDDVTDGYVSVKMTATMNAAVELEQKNADGKVCVVDRTAPERKYYKVDVDLCNVNTGLISLFSGWEQVLDYAGESAGYRDQMEVDSDYGVALEVWTGGRSEDDCPLPSDDDIFATNSTGKSYGYLLIGAYEWMVGDISVTSGVSTLMLSGTSIAMPQWGKGPYNVQGIDSKGTCGRLITPLNEGSHYTFFRTTCPPPPVTEGQEPVALEIGSVFKAPDYYFGGPGGAPAAEVAPEGVTPDVPETSPKGTAVASGPFPDKGAVAGVTPDVPSRSPSGIPTSRKACSRSTSFPRSPPTSLTNSGSSIRNTRIRSTAACSTSTRRRASRA